MTISSLCDIIDETSELKPFAIVAGRLMTACEDPNTTATDMANIIQCDPAIPLRMLCVADSSMYGFSGEIRTIEQAVVVMGFRAVRNLVVSAAAAEVFAADDKTATNKEALWQHSLACATIGRLLVRDDPGIGADEAFLAGIVHDVGKLIFYDHVLDEYTTATTDVGSSGILAREEQVFGITHQQVGQRCGEQWGLPDDIVEAISHHHEPDSATDGEQLVRVVSVANQLSRIWGVGGLARTDDDPQRVCDDAGISIETDSLDQLQTRAAAEFEQIKNAYS